MEKRIRFSEVQLNSDVGKTLQQIAKSSSLNLSDKAIEDAILACDVYEPFTSKERKNIEEPKANKLPTVSDDYFDSRIDFSRNDKGTMSLSKDVRNAQIHTYGKDLLQNAPNIKKDTWDMKAALTTGQKIKIAISDPDYERIGIQNEAILLNTYIYLMGKGPQPAVLARPAHEDKDGNLIVFDEPINVEQIRTYLLVQFSYNIRQGMFDVLRPSVNSDNPTQDRRRRKWGLAKTLACAPEDLDLDWFYTLGMLFLTEGFWDTVRATSNLTRVRDNPNKDGEGITEEDIAELSKTNPGKGTLNVDKGLLLDTKTQEYLSSAKAFNMDHYDDSVTCLMNWIGYQIRLRFNYYRKIIGVQQIRTLSSTPTISSDEMQSQVDEKSGASRLEKEMFKSGAYIDSPEDEIAINQSLEAFFKKEKFWLTDLVENFNDTYPILRYMAAMIEYPCCPGTIILNAVGSGHIDPKGKHINNWAGIFTSDRRPAKGSLTQLSIEVSKKLKKYGILDFFMGLVNHFGGEVYRTKILNNLKKIFDEFKGIPDKSATIPLTFKPHTESEIRSIQTKGVGYWYLVDNNYVQRSLDKWDKYSKPLEGTENENLIELGENMIMDACDYNMNAIVSTYAYSPITSLLKKTPEIRELLDNTEKKAKEEEEARHKASMERINKALAKDAGVRSEEDLSNWDNVDEGDIDNTEIFNVNESIFKSIYKNYMKKKLFETIYKNAQKRRG